MFIRLLFVLLRFTGYGIVFVILARQQANHIWWQWLIGILVWLVGTVEYWKHPNEVVNRMRWGVWLEIATIVIWALAMGHVLVLLLLISPVARTSVHLDWKDKILVLLCSVACVFSARWMMLVTLLMTWGELAAIFGAFMYSLVLGEMLRQRDVLRRVEQIAMFEREQRANDDERTRLAGRLHDTTGQYWIAVIRALDVALEVDGERRSRFIEKARSTAMDGLSEMREATHAWHAGRATPDEWLRYAELALKRLEELSGLYIQRQLDELAWQAMSGDSVRVAELLARTMIEGVMNAIKHGLAHRITVQLWSEGANLQLVIQDNGNGLSTQKDVRDGIGISALRRMAEECGGVLRLESKRVHGTTLTLTLPFVS